MGLESLQRQQAPERRADGFVVIDDGNRDG
jgi:hypothetical protein